MFNYNLSRKKCPWHQCLCGYKEKKWVHRLIKFLVLLYIIKSTRKGAVWLAAQHTDSSCYFNVTHFCYWLRRRSRREAIAVSWQEVLQNQKCSKLVNPLPHKPWRCWMPWDLPTSKESSSSFLKWSCSHWDIWCGFWTKPGQKPRCRWGDATSSRVAVPGGAPRDCSKT